MSLKLFPAGAWPTDAGWIDPEVNCTQLQYSIVIRALKDVGILEQPLGSNRGKRIDEYAKRAGVPPGSYWCAIWAGAVYADCGALIPMNYAGTDYWLPYVVSEPVIGAAILYGLRKKGPVRDDMDAHHIGIVVRMDPMLVTIEGNRSFAGTASNNGIAVDIGPVTRKDILGYFHPRTA